MGTLFRFCSVKAETSGSGLPDLEHPGAADGARALGCRLTVLHRDGLRVFHIPFNPALEAVGFQLVLLLSRPRVGGSRQIDRVSTQMRRFAGFQQA